MKLIICAVVLLQSYVDGKAAIINNALFNKLIKPVGRPIGSKFLSMTELPHPHPHTISGRRHLNEDCTEKYHGKEVHEGGKVEIFGEYYDDGIAKTVATVIIPDHIDRKIFEITTQEPYFTVGTIDALGYHPTTMKSEHPAECEKIYQDHLDEQYNTAEDDDTDSPEESMEMARMPLVPPPGAPEAAALEDKIHNMYDDINN